MALTFKIKRGTKTDHIVYVGQQGELTMVTDSGEEAVRLHDGSTQGGFELARKDLKNVNIPLGGVNFEYTFESAAIPSTAPILTGQIGFNNDDPSSATELIVSEIDVHGTNLVTFLETIGTVSNAIVGHFKLYRKDDASKFKIFEITGSTDENDQFVFDI